MKTRFILLLAPSVPGSPKMKAKTEIGVTYIQISWEPPAVPRGPIEYSVINISSSADEFEEYRVEGIERDSISCKFKIFFNDLINN